MTAKVGAVRPPDRNSRNHELWACCLRCSIRCDATHAREKHLQSRSANVEAPQSKEVARVGLFSKTEEEQRAAAAAKASRQADREAAAFWASPVGQARTAFAQGDKLFQVDFEVMEQTAEIVAMMGSFDTQKANNPTVVLNAIHGEGWELVTGSFVFVVQGEQSRDKFMASGQNVAVKGATVGYYLFRRAEQNRNGPSLD